MGGKTVTSYEVGGKEEFSVSTRSWGKPTILPSTLTEDVRKVLVWRGPWLLLEEPISYGPVDQHGRRFTVVVDGVSLEPYPRKDYVGSFFLHGLKHVYEVFE